MTNQSIETPLASEISDLVETHSESRHERTPNACGLGGALQAGLERSSEPIVARMDADDVAAPARLAEQRAILLETDTDIVGTHLAEFRDDPNRPIRTRRVPRTHKMISEQMPWRCPLNHPTVMFDRRAILNVGGYRNVPMMEDWDLWARCLASGLRFRNLDRVLVSAQINELADRRGGWEYVKAEIAMAHELRNLGIASPLDTFRHLSFRIPPRLLPRRVRRVVYDVIVR